MTAHRVRSVSTSGLFRPVPSIVQTCTNATAPATSITGTFSSTVRVGSLVMVSAGQGNTNTTQSTCSGGSQTWHKLYSHTACQVVGYWTIATAGFTTVTVSWPGNTYTGIQGFEIANLGAGPHFYGACKTTTWASPTMWFPKNTLVMYHIYMTGGGGNSWSQSGWSLVGGSNSWCGVFYKITTADGDVNCPWGGNAGSGPLNSLFGIGASGYY